MIDRLFVYGTLRKDVSHSMHHLLSCDARFIGYAQVSGRLYDLGDYPGLVIGGKLDVNASTSRVDRCVKGELYAININDDLLLGLDTYEGCAGTQPTPHEFNRVVVDTLLTNGTTVRAWTYIYAMTTIDKPEITSGDYAKYKARGR